MRVLAGIILYVVAGCTILAADAVAAAAVVAEVQYIQLAGEAADSNAQFSGMDWWGDSLILLPQYPDWDSAQPVVFAITKREILSFLASDDPQPIKPTPYLVFIPDKLTDLDGFDGFESIYFDGDNVYLTIEMDVFGTMFSYVVRGLADSAMHIIYVDANLVRLPTPVQVHNVSYEAMTKYEDYLYIIYEANTKRLQDVPVAYRCTTNLAECVQVPMEAVEARVTDATRTDRSGGFYAVNTYDKKSAKKVRANKREDECYFHTGSEHGVEKIIALAASDEGVFADLTHPALCLRHPDKEPLFHNWEGIARLDNRGFLLITDTRPETVFGFVEMP